jgi:hypothetical protein
MVSQHWIEHKYKKKIDDIENMQLKNLTKKYSLLEGPKFQLIDYQVFIVIIFYMIT